MKQIDTEEIHDYIVKTMKTKGIKRYDLKKDVNYAIERLPKIAKGRISVRKLNEILAYLQ